MFKEVTKLLGAIALTGWMGVANATLIFDFSWDSDNGKIIGEIVGLTNVGGTQSATGIVLSSIGGVIADIDVVNDPGWAVDFNSFQVVENVLSNWDFLSILKNNDGTELGFFNLYLEEDEIQLKKDNIIYSSSDIAFVNRVTVPEPSSVILLSLGFAGLSFARYRKQY